MRERGDLGFSATGDVGATATWLVAACICRGLRRQYAITSLPFSADLLARRRVSNAFSIEAAPPFGPRSVHFRMACGHRAPNPWPGCGEINQAGFGRASQARIVTEKM
jgi:hypothetical protein